MLLSSLIKFCIKFEINQKTLLETSLNLCCLQWVWHWQLWKRRRPWFATMGKNFRKNYLHINCRCYLKLTLFPFQKKTFRIKCKIKITGLSDQFLRDYFAFWNLLNTIWKRCHLMIANLLPQLQIIHFQIHFLLFAVTNKNGQIRGQNLNLQ